MNQVLEFGKRNAKWLIAGIAAVSTAVIGYVVYNKMTDEGEYTDVVESDADEPTTDED